MPTLKNAMNAGSHLLNQGTADRLELDTSWTIPYQRFDAVMRHLTADDREVALLNLNGFFDSFTAVHDYAQEHGFADVWHVQVQAASIPRAPEGVTEHI